MDALIAAVLLLWPLVLCALFLGWSLRERKRRGGPVVHVESWSRAQRVAVLAALLVGGALISGAQNGWALESLLLPVGWLVTGLAIGLLVWWFRRS